MDYQVLHGVDWDIDGLIGAGDPDGPDNDTLTTLFAGIYVAYVTDSTNGCVTIHSDTVSIQELFISSLFDSVSCNGLFDGSASVVAQVVMVIIRIYGCIGGKSDN